MAALPPPAMGAANLKEASEKLLGPLPEALKVATELRDRIERNEVVHTAEYGTFLSTLFPAFKVRS